MDLDFNFDARFSLLRSADESNLDDGIGHDFDAYDQVDYDAPRDTVAVKTDNSEYSRTLRSMAARVDATLDSPSSTLPTGAVSSTVIASNGAASSDQNGSIHGHHGRHAQHHTSRYEFDYDCTLPDAYHSQSNDLRASFYDVHLAGEIDYRTEFGSFYNATIHHADNATTTNNSLTNLIDATNSYLTPVSAKPTALLDMKLGSMSKPGQSTSPLNASSYMTPASNKPNPIEKSKSSKKTIVAASKSTEELLKLTKKPLRRSQKNNYMPIAPCPSLPIAPATPYLATRPFSNRVSEYCDMYSRMNEPFGKSHPAQLMPNDTRSSISSDVSSLASVISGRSGSAHGMPTATLFNMQQQAYFPSYPMSPYHAPLHHSPAHRHQQMPYNMPSPLPEDLFTMQPNFNDMPALSEYVASKQKRTKHVCRACFHCKKAHLACDDQRPCRRCIHIGKSDVCYDVEHKRRGRPNRGRQLQMSAML